MTKTSFRRMLTKTPMRDLLRGRITGRLDIDWLLDQSSLSGAAAGKVRNVVKRTRLWRLEKVDVANELIAHFLDGLKTGAPLDELLETFGDERQTAKLIRRAKKRQRPMVWHAFAWARLCFTVFFGAYFVAALYLMTGSPSVTTEYLAILNRNAAGVPTDQAAWPIYREALHEMGYIGHGNNQGLPVDIYLRPGNEGWSKLSAYLTEHAGALAKVREATGRPKCGYMVSFRTAPEDEVLFGDQDKELKPYMGPNPPLMLLPLAKNIKPMRSLAGLMSADCSRALEVGDGNTAFADVVALIGLARHTDEIPNLINGLIRMSILRYTYTATQEVLTNRPGLWSDEQLRNLAHRFAAIDITPEDMLNGERLYFYDYLQRTYTDDGHGGGRVINPSPVDFHAPSIFDGRSIARIAILPAWTALTVPRDKMRRMYDGLMDRTILEIRRTLWLDDESETVDQTVAKLRGPMLSRFRYVLITTLMPSLTTLRTTLQTDAGLRDGVLVGIALELYKRKHGDWPGALEELVPGYLPEVPVDRLTGEPLRYRVTGEGPVVYSVGVDGDDDGGRVPVDEEGEVDNDVASPKRFYADDTADKAHDGDWVLWPVPWEE